MNTDESLIQAAKAGDEDALTALLERYGIVVRQGLRINPHGGGQVDLDDVMQVTYVEAFLGIRGFQPNGPGSFLAWLRRIAENNLRDALRKLDREERNLPRATPDADSYTTLVARLSGTSTTPSQAARRREIQDIVEACLRNLPPDYEKVLRLYELEGLSGPEVAAAMGRTHGAVRMLLARAREHLLQLLQPYGSIVGDTA